MDIVFENYVREHSADLTRLCVSLCSDLTEAEDLFQETWLKAMKNYGQYNCDYPFRKWLFSICVNTYKDKKRLFYNKRKKLFKTTEDKTEFLNSIPDITREDCDDYLTLHEAVNSLPKKLRVVLVLYYFDDYSLSEISDTLKIPLGTVKSRMNNAKSILRRRLEDE